MSIFGGYFCPELNRCYALNMHNRAPKDLIHMVPWYSSVQKISFCHLHAFSALVSPRYLPANLEISLLEGTQSWTTKQNQSRNSLAWKPQRLIFGVQSMKKKVPNVHFKMSLCGFRNLAKSEQVWLHQWLFLFLESLETDHLVSFEASAIWNTVKRFTTLSVVWRQVAGISTGPVPFLIFRRPLAVLFSGWTLLSVFQEDLSCKIVVKC